MPDILYGKNKVFLDSALRLMFTKIELLRDSFDTTESDNPIRHYCGRAKSAESMADKLQRKNLEQTFDDAVTRIHDAVGVRIICGFVDDVYRVVEAIKEMKDVHIIAEKDFIASPKPNGYRSYHLIIELSIYIPGKNMMLPVEIQLRTIAQDSWAELEHTLKYKKEIKSCELIQKELKRVSDEMASADLSLQTLRDMINGEKSES